MARVLVTGSSGLVGRALSAALEARGHGVVRLDLRATGASAGDVRDRARVAAAMDGVDGVVHLAAVSRVIWGERDPEGCWSTNVGGLSNVLELAERAPRPPWVIFASSREVYGQPERLPVDEDAPLSPLNVYGRSKVEGEGLVAAARGRGLGAAIVRFSNVYGDPEDHGDRVIPAFVRGALAGATLRVDGSEHVFDFTHLDDTVDAVLRVVERLEAGAPPPPLHFVTGRATTLGELARLAITLAGSASRVEEAPSRSYDVARFVGSWARAERELGWRPRTTLEEGLSRLAAALRGER